jgi:hypothetical protein
MICSRRAGELRTGGAERDVRWLLGRCRGGCEIEVPGWDIMGLMNRRLRW